MARTRRDFLKTAGIAGTTVLAGSRVPGHAGAADISRRLPATAPPAFSQTARLSSGDTDSGWLSQFGSGVDVSSDGTTAVIGTGTTQTPTYIFEVSGGSWREQAAFDVGDAPVAVSGDGTTALVGAPEANTQNGDETGAAYVFEKDGGSWSRKTMLAADDGESADSFGRAITVSNDGATAVVGASGDEEYRGAAYVFGASGGSWSQQAKLVAEDSAGDFVGSSLSVSNDGSTVVVGAPQDDDPNGQQAGSAYVFERSSGSWSQGAKLAAEDGGREDQFGGAVSLSGDGTTALVGASAANNANGEYAGSAYVFQRDGGSWSQQVKLLADDGDDFDSFATSVALNGAGTLAVFGAGGDTNDRGEEAGSAYVFEASDGSWSQRAKHTADDDHSGTTEGTEPSNPTAVNSYDNDQFGDAVTVSDDGTTAVIGAPGDAGEHGAAYVFESAGSATTQSEAPTSGESGPGFGVLSALAGLGGAGYALSRLRDDDRT
jgi:PGF-CTERM protein